MPPKSKVSDRVRCLMTRFDVGSEDRHGDVDTGIMLFMEIQEGAVLTFRDLHVFVELGLCLCSRLPGKVDNQTD